MQFDSTTINMLVKGIWETIYMVFLSSALSYVIGIPLGIALVVTDKEGISPVMIPSYDNGYKRLTAVTSQAALVPITRSQIALLPGWIGAAEKVGMCHMLANRKEIQWVDEDDGTV